MSLDYLYIIYLYIVYVLGKLKVVSHVAGTLAWLNNFLSRSGSLRAQLQALQGIKDPNSAERERSRVGRARFLAPHAIHR